MFKVWQKYCLLICKMSNCGSHGLLAGLFSKTIFSLFQQIFCCFENRGDLNVLKHIHDMFLQPSSRFPARFASSFISPSHHDFLVQTESQDLQVSPLLSPQTYCSGILFSLISTLNPDIHVSLSKR